MTNYTLQNTKLKKERKLSAVNRYKYNKAVQELHSKHPINLRQSIKLILWAEEQL